MLVPAIVKEARRVAIEILLTPDTATSGVNGPGLISIRAGDSGTRRIVSLDGVEFIAKTAADDVHHPRTRRRNRAEPCVQRRPGAGRREIERLAGNQLGQVCSGQAAVLTLMCAQSQGGPSMTCTEINEV